MLLITVDYSCVYCPDLGNLAITSTRYSMPKQSSTLHEMQKLMSFALLTMVQLCNISLLAKNKMALAKQMAVETFMSNFCFPPIKMC